MKVIKKEAKMRKFIIFAIFISIIALPVAARPKYSLNLGYSFWSLNLIKGLIEDAVGDELQTQLQDQIRGDFPEETLADYNQTINFDSSGGGLVIELRIYPSGENGSFSLGFSYARIDSNIELSGDFRQNFVSGDYITATADSKLVHKYSAFLLDLRWDLFPEGKIHPYFSIGGGLAPLNGTLTYSATGFAYIDKKKEKYNIEEETEELTDIEDITISIVPILLVNAGIRVELYEGMSVYADGGVWNGFLFRVGLSYAF